MCNKPFQTIEQWALNTNSNMQINCMQNWYSICREGTLLKKLLLISTKRRTNRYFRWPTCLNFHKHCSLFQNNTLNSSLSRMVCDFFANLKNHSETSEHEVCKLSYTIATFVNLMFRDTFAFSHSTYLSLSVFDRFWSVDLFTNETVIDVIESHTFLF